MTAPYYTDDAVTLYHGDCLDILATLPDDSIDAVVTDPPYGLEFMGNDWDGADGFRRSLNAADAGRDNAFGRASRTSPEYRAGATFQEWCEAWTAECLRVLKPGGHMLAFGGSRTWHRLAAAVEDAGFEIRDSIAWLYGSGFPKSLDVSKAITGAQMGVGSNSGAIRRATMGDEYEPSGVRGNRDGVTRRSDTGMAGRDLPLTTDAQRWQGWGTALKPAFEPIVVGRKPLVSSSTNVLKMVESSLREQGVQGEIRWTRRPVSGVERHGRQNSSSSIEAQQTVEVSAARVAANETPNAAPPTSNDSVPSIEPGARRTESACEPRPANTTGSSATQCSTPMEGSAPAAASSGTSSSPSITSTAAVPPTESQSTARSTANCADKDSRPGTESFAGIATGLTTSMAIVRIDRLADGTFVWPDGLPEYVKGAPLTVAANVLEYGAGALNIDGCRVEGPKPATTRGASVKASSMAGPLGGQGRIEDDGLGRWPANVVLDESQAAELDRQSGVLTSGVLAAHHARAPKDAGILGAYGSAEGECGYGDSGGASRFFPTFRYEAKAPTAERPRVGGVAHPTVKPLDLMRWLVRLVTPPGGVVLEPFAGSGTTAEACVVEGFQCIAIEKLADYLPLIVARLTKPIEMVLDFGDAS